MAERPFDNVRDQIGRCGIWCGSCGAGNGALQILSRRYVELIENYGLPQWGPKDVDYDKFKSWLGLIGEMPLCNGCLQGDGNPDCKLRPCAEERDFSDCVECDRFGSCSRDEELKKVRDGALDAGFFVKQEKAARRKLIEKWTAKMKDAWPSSVLFLED